jgi:2-polyprenyl-6-hydroxyphenyl methylase/3-demethylubiquinone-9 3-methyltransferase
MSPLETAQASTHAAEVKRGQRFEFGKNWNQFLTLLNDERIARAESSLQRFLQVEHLRGSRFLDIGSGSGLFSLAARRLGARVHSFDFDPQSVACTQELRRRYFPGDDAWTIDEASALDAKYIRSLGQFDIVYSWGVLHHTGQMWRALENADLAVAPSGKLFIAIYNDTGSQARRWLTIKRIYNRLPRFMQTPFAAVVSAPSEGKHLLRSILQGRPGDYVRSWTKIEPLRGMNHWRDILDWVGGYPYEFATPDQIFEFYSARGYILTRMHCGGVGLGCNEFVFSKAR